MNVGTMTIIKGKTFDIAVGTAILLSIAFAFINWSKKNRQYMYILDLMCHENGFWGIIKWIVVDWLKRQGKGQSANGLVVRTIVFNCNVFKRIFAVFAVERLLEKEVIHDHLIDIFDQYVFIQAQDKRILVARRSHIRLSEKVN